MILFNNLKFKTLVLLIQVAIIVSAQEPTGYYASAEGKNTAALKTALHEIISDHNVLEYYTSSTYFRSTDWNPAGYFWDMYSNTKRTYWTGMNREHSLPKSWWSTAPESTVPYSDLHNLYPSDADANTAKSNYPLGVVSSASYTNGVVKVGTNSYPGYSGTVFEPANEYKGDFARTYMYMVTCYEDYAPNWRSLGTSSMLYTNTYPVFKPYAVSLLMEWSRNDPVSKKEIDRNNAVYELQNNRNPFVDHPELAEFIWGNRISELWESGVGVTSEFVLRFNSGNNTVSVNISKPELATAKVYNPGGILLFSGNFDSTGNIDVSQLQNGFYIMLIYTGSTRENAKFIISR